MPAPTKLFATTSDVATVLGRSLASTETLHVSNLILLASQMAAEETNNYRFAPGDYTIGRFLTSRHILLPAASTLSVTAVRKIDQTTGAATLLTSGTHYNTRGRTIYILNGSTSDVRFSFDIPRLNPLFWEIDFTVTDAIPTEIVALVIGIVTSTFTDPMTAASNDGGSFAVSRVSSTGKVWFSASDKMILRKYKQTKNALEVIA